MNYTQLVAGKTTANSIKAWLNWDKAPSTDILTEAEAYLYGKLRVTEMKTKAEGTIALNATTLALPTDYIAAISFRRIGAAAGRIEVLDSDHMEGRMQIEPNGDFMASVPSECQIIGSPPVAYFDCKSDDDHDYRLIYFKRPAALAGGNLTNFLTNRYPKLLRTACLMSGFEYYQKPEQEQKYEKRLDKLIFEANREYDMGEQINRMEMHTGE